MIQIQNSSSRRLDVVNLSDIQQTEVSWLWEPYIPLGKVSFLDGDPESGKTYIALELAAAVTTGRVVSIGIPVEGQSPVKRNPANVLYLSAEDNLGDTIKPRFVRQGGDESRFLAAQGLVQDQGDKKCFTAFHLSCVAELEERLEQYTPELVVIDPIQAFLGAKVDMHRANEVRPVLMGLSKLAERRGCAILLIRHLNKAASMKAMYRALGSVDMAAAARSILLAGRHPAEKDGRVLAHLKSSLGPRGESVAYTITEAGLKWQGVADLSADDLVASPIGAAASSVEAEAFLKEYLSGGPKPATEVYAAANQRGISQGRLARRAKALGVVRKPNGYQQGWIFMLPSSPKEGLLPLAARG